MMKRVKTSALILTAAMLFGACTQEPATESSKVSGMEETDKEIVSPTEEPTTEEPTTEAPQEVFVVYCTDPLSAAFCRQFAAEQDAEDVLVRVVESEAGAEDAWKTLSAEEEDYPDVVIVSNSELQQLAGDGMLLPVESVGIAEEDMEQMYEFMLDFGKTDGTLYGLTWQQTAKMFLYNRILAEELLDAENGDDTQAAIGEWSGFGNMANVVNRKSEGAVSLISSSEEILEAFETLTPSWYEEEALHIPDVMMDYIEIYPLFMDGKLTVSQEKDSEAQLAGLVDGSIVGCFADAYYIRQVLEATGATVDGEWGVCYGPQQYADEAQLAAVTAGCENTDLARSLLLYLTCDADAMEEFASAELVPVNNKEVMDTLSKDDAGKLPLLKNQNIFKSYTGAAKRMDIHEESDTETFLRVMFLQEIKSCIAGEKNIEEAIESFVKRVDSVL